MQKLKAVSLLSGGLDSVVSTAVAAELYDIVRTVFFDYGQRAVDAERKSVKAVSAYYGVDFQEIRLDWLKEITGTSLVNRENCLPEYTTDSLDSDIATLEQSARAVWVPNRNGVMLNITAAIAESLEAGYIIFGANAEEAVTFPDNTQEYTDVLTRAFAYSTSNQVSILVPLSNMTKTEIVQLALAKQVPLELVRSCYTNEEKHCGKCESCARLKRALISNSQQALWEKIAAR